MIVIVTVGICLVIAALGLYFQVRYTARSVTQGPALLTMLGIGGTFFGIAVGLLYFNPADVQSGIPGLLNGMRIAVWASFTGILFAILLKLRYALGHEEGTETEDKSDAEIIASQLQALQRSITGDDEATVISQMKLARSDMNDRLDALKRSQAEFMERLAEMSSKTLIEALRDVIKDFNVKITEQFGDNFKELNAAVARLVTWQEQYREQMDELIRLERESAATLQTAVNQHKEALASSSSLLTVALGFKSILEAADAYKSSLRENSERLAVLIEQMHRDLPTVRDDIVDLVETVSASITRSEAEVARIGAEISERFKAAAASIQDELATSLGAANREVNENISRLVGSTKEQTEALQLQLEESLNESLRSLAQQMASLSNKFAEDYGPITERLRDILNSGKVTP
jgi:DNA anti-recombination protein RmuC